MAAFTGEKFQLPVNFDLTTLPKKDEKICIVSIVGKTLFTQKSCKAVGIDHLLDRNIFQGFLNDCNNEINDHFVDSCKIEGYYDCENRVIFLHLLSSYDTYTLAQACEKAAEDIANEGYFKLWQKLEHRHAKALLLLFSISHIIIAMIPGATFDISYVRLFRTLDTVRLKAMSCIVDLLQGLSVSKDWLSAGRPCSPRVLFVFEACPLEISREETDHDSGLGKVRSKRMPTIKKLEHSLEDQIYRILRKSRVITNTSGNSLFAVPANQEFVYVYITEAETFDSVGFFINQLKQYCVSTKESDISGAKNYQNNSRSSSSTTVSSNGCIKHFQGGVSTTERSFRNFLWQHIDLALTHGFDDNVGRHPAPAFFECPTNETWFRISTKLYEFFMGDHEDTRTKSYFNSLKALLEIDMRFSEGRCGKVLPIALSAYQENLPPHYTGTYHQTKLAQAMRVFFQHARGPAVERYVKQLQDECDKIWKNGRQLCEEISLTGNHCVNPLHRMSEITEEDASQGFSQAHHSSQMETLCTCNCGRKQASREDPFDLKAANYDFYKNLEKDCCEKLEHIEFPMFKASTSDVKAAHIIPFKIPISKTVKDPTRSDINLLNTVHSNMSLALSLGQSGASDIFPHDCGTSLNADALEIVDGPEGLLSVGNQLSIHLRAVVDDKGDKALIRQPSTTEYLPGMLHSESPAGLLPKYPSWSLLCIGPSSLYSHNAGIVEQPGFYSGTNYLLPWDVVVKIESKEKWPAIDSSNKKGHIKGKKGQKDSSEFNVKIFVGFEYECPRGHRFMCSAPDKVLKASSSGLVKDNASKIMNNDMPLYFPCPCRTTKTCVAQLMRVHIVTPKALVHVTLNPKVQPAPPPCPIFFPGLDEPAKLSQSTYWILRLPYVYMGNQGPYYPPKDVPPPGTSRLFKGMIEVQEASPEK